MKFVDELDLAGKRVFLRADLNVPLTKDGSIADDIRVQATLPTIEAILERGGSVVLASHLGRPDGVRNEKYSLAPVATHLTKLLKREVTLTDDCVSQEAQQKAAALRPGEVLLLENLRFHAEEEANDPDFCKTLASMADVYVNDAFGTAHRKHASTYGITKYCAVKAGGLTMKAELRYFAQAFENPQRPLVAIFGGAKISTKLSAITNVAKTADKIIVGGAMANTFFAARGLNVGRSLYEPQEFDNARRCEEALREQGCELHLPVDVVVAPELKAGVKTSIVPVSAIGEEEMALDIGPETIAAFKQALTDAKTIVWNGPMGAFETEEFSAGTFAIVDALAESKALTVVGGGDTDLALHQRHAFEAMDYVSTGGGAFLKLLEGKQLPAIEALK